jgi:hypothetical protein
MAHRLKKRHLPFVLAAGIACLGAGGSGDEAVSPLFRGKFEEQQVRARNYLQGYYEGILITGTAEYITAVRAALELIETADSSNWYYVRKHVRRITLTGHAGIDIASGRFTSGTGEVGGVEFLAGSLVHDSWHRELYVSGKKWEGREAEIFCLEKQNGFLAGANATPVDLEAALASEYWKIDYWSRDW